MITGIRHFGIVVENFEKSLKFYKDILGFEPVNTVNENSAFIDEILALKLSRLKTCKLKSPDGNIIELLDFRGHTIPRKNFISSTGPTHFAVTVADAQEAFDKLKAKGIQFISEPQLSPDGFAKVAFCKAPEGTYIEIVEVLK